MNTVPVDSKMLSSSALDRVEPHHHSIISWAGDSRRVESVGGFTGPGISAHHPGVINTTRALNHLNPIDIDPSGLNLIWNCISIDVVDVRLLRVKRRTIRL